MTSNAEPAGRADGYQVFRDRSAAGDALGADLARRGLVSPVVLGMARGGVPVAARVTERLRSRGRNATERQVDLDVIVSRKISAPESPEMAVGAVSENGVVLVERAAVDGMRINPANLESLIASAQHEVERRVRAFRPDTVRLELAGRQVVLVDDGIATGNTARAALDSILALDPARVVLAAPVAARSALGNFNDIEVVCLSHPYPFVAVGVWYRNFGQVSDEEVLSVLGRSAKH